MTHSTGQDTKMANSTSGPWYRLVTMLQLCPSLEENWLPKAIAMNKDRHWAWTLNRSNLPSWKSFFVKILSSTSGSTRHRFYAVVPATILNQTSHVLPSSLHSPVVTITYVAKYLLFPFRFANFSGESICLHFEFIFFVKVKDDVLQSHKLHTVRQPQNILCFVRFNTMRKGLVTKVFY